MSLTFRAAVLPSASMKLNSVLRCVELLGSRAVSLTLSQHS